jgi:hypothetical protein
MTMKIWTLKNDKAYKIEYMAADANEFEDGKLNDLTAKS